MTFSIWQVEQTAFESKIGTLLNPPLRFEPHEYGLTLTRACSVFRVLETSECWGRPRDQGWSFVLRHAAGSLTERIPKRGEIHEICHMDSPGAKRKPRNFIEICHTRFEIMASKFPMAAFRNSYQPQTTHNHRSPWRHTVGGAEPQTMGVGVSVCCFEVIGKILSCACVRLCMPACQEPSNWSRRVISWDCLTVPAPIVAPDGTFRKPIHRYFKVVRSWCTWGET